MPIGGIPMPGGGIPPGGIMPGGMSMGGIPAGPCDKMNKSESDIHQHKVDVCRMFAAYLPKITCWIQLHQLSRTSFHSYQLSFELWGSILLAGAGLLQHVCLRV
jgi:hypothetical protein